MEYGNELRDMSVAPDPAEGSRADLDRYYADRNTGAGITIHKAVRLPAPVLTDLLPSGVPPQSYAYIYAVC